MAIGTYSELKTAIASWSHRSNVITSARAAEFISLFEVTAVTDAAALRKNEIMAPLTATIASSFINLPSDFDSAVSLKVTADQRRLVYVVPDLLPYYPARGPSDRWTITDSRIQTERDADQAYAYTLRYHLTFALSDAAPTNVLLTKYPNVYLYGSLLEAAPFVRDLLVIDLWQYRYDRAIATLNKAETAYKKLGTLAVDPTLMRRPSAFNIIRGE